MCYEKLAGLLNFVTVKAPYFNTSSSLRNKKIQAMFSYIYTIGMFYLPRKYEAQSLILKSCFEIAPLQKLFFVALIVSTQLIQWDKGKKYTRPA